ncbi:MAG TPA: hypothetical protein VHG89_04710 [Verrucomicrobiae bacterium]|nr:hypothetical protein [Verrucomicrobiae bacterium]
MNPACEQCKFWTRWPKQPESSLVIGDCRRHAPQLFQCFDQKDGREKFTTKFPTTRHNEFCGSFKARLHEG